MFSITFSQQLVFHHQMQALDTEIEVDFDFENVEIEIFVTCYIFYHYFSFSDVLLWLIKFFNIIIIFKFYILY
jgi:hypothetical protein